MGNPRCKWIRERLPLLAGDELVGLDRRRVERHLIGCPECHQHRDALANALEVLYTASAHSSTAPDAPSLWPALARQIRESRRPAPTPVFSMAWPRWGWWPPVLGLSGLGLLAAIGIAVGLVRSALPVVARAPVPVPSLTRSRPAIPPTIEAVSAPRPEQPLGVSTSIPAPAHDLPRPAADTMVDESTPTPKIDYDLEHGTPMLTDSPSPRDARQPTY